MPANFDHISGLVRGATFVADYRALDWLLSEYEWIGPRDATCMDHTFHPPIERTIAIAGTVSSRSQSFSLLDETFFDVDDSSSGSLVVLPQDTAYAGVAYETLRDYVTRLSAPSYLLVGASAQVDHYQPYATGGTPGGDCRDWGSIDPGPPGVQSSVISYDLTHDYRFFPTGIVGVSGVSDGTFGILSGLTMPPDPYANAYTGDPTNEAADCLYAWSDVDEGHADLTLNPSDYTAHLLDNGDARIQFNVTTWYPRPADIERTWMCVL